MPSITMSQVLPVTRTEVRTTILASGQTVSTTVVPVGTQTFRQVQKTWVRTPGYRELVASGATLPDNSFSYSSFQLEHEQARAMFYTPVSGGVRRTEVWRTPGASVGVYLPAYTITDSDVSGRLIGKAKHAEWNIPVFLAEAKSTTQMVAKSATHLAQMAMALRSGNIKRFLSMFHPTVTKRPSRAYVRRFQRAFPKDPGKTAGNAWLELNYGWLPFMADVRSAVIATMDAVELPERRVATVRASIRKENRVVLKDQQIWAESGLGLVVRGDYLQVSKESRRGIWRLSVNPNDLPARFGLVNPFEVIWELIPLSFVVDWFLSIGDYLKALDVPFRFNHLGGTFGRRMETWMTTLNARATAPSGATCSGVGGTGYRVEVVRIPMVSPPSVKLAWKGSSLGLTRLTSACALLGQAIGRLR